MTLKLYTSPYLVKITYMNICEVQCVIVLFLGRSFYGGDITKKLVSGNFILLMATFIMSDASASKKLLPGECLAQVYTKKYINNHDKKKIYGGMHYIYSCDYTCIDNNFDKTSVRAIHSKRVYSESEMARSVVCDGVKMKRYETASVSFYEFSHVESFYSMDSDLKEIKNWSKANNIPSFSLRLKKKIGSIKKKLEGILVSYELTAKSLEDSDNITAGLFMEAAQYIRKYISLEGEELYKLMMSLKNTKLKNISKAENMAQDILKAYLGLYL